MSYGGTSATPGQRSQTGMPARGRANALPQTGQNSQVRQQAHLHLTNPQAMQPMYGQPAQGNVMFNPMYAATPQLTAPMSAGYPPQSYYFVSQQATAPAQTATPNVYYTPPTAQMPAQSQQQPAGRPPSNPGMAGGLPTQPNITQMPSSYQNGVGIQPQLAQIATSQFAPQSMHSAGPRLSSSMHMGTPPVPTTYHKPQARKSSAIAIVDPNTKVVINEDQLSTNIEEPSNIQVTPTSSNRSTPAPQHFTSEPSQHINVTAAPPTKEKSSTDIGAQFRAQVVASLSNSSISATSESTPPSLPSSLPNGSTVTTTTAAPSTSTPSHSDKSAQLKMPPKDTEDTSSASTDAANAEALSTTQAPAVSENDVTPPETATPAVKSSEETKPVDPELSSEGTQQSSAEPVGEAVVEPETAGISQSPPQLQVPELSSTSEDQTVQASVDSSASDSPHSDSVDSVHASPQQQMESSAAAPPTESSNDTSDVTQTGTGVEGDSAAQVTEEESQVEPEASQPTATEVKEEAAAELVVQTDGEKPVRTGDVKPVQTGDENPVQTGGENPVQTGGENPVQTGDEKPVQTGGANPVLTGGANPVLTGDVKLVQTGDVKLVQTGGANPVLTGDVKPVQTGDVKLVQTGGANPVLTGDVKLVQTGHEKPVQTGDDKAGTTVTLGTDSSASLASKLIKTSPSDAELMPPPATPPATSPVTPPTPTTKTVLIENKENTPAVTTSSPQKGSKPVTPDSSKQPVVEADVKTDENGKPKTYSREFLMSLQKVELSLAKPDGLGNNILQEIMSSGRSMPNVSSHRRDFNPDYFKPANSKPEPRPVSSANFPMSPRNSMSKRASVSRDSKMMGGSASHSRTPQHTITYKREDVKLRKVENAWKPGDKAVESLSEEEKAHAELLKKFRGMLNKITPSTFKPLLEKSLQLPVRTEKDLNEVMMLVFDKARNEPEFSKIYATLCQSIAKEYKVKKDGSGEEVNFRKLLLVRCQKEFEMLAQDDTLMLEKMQNLDKALEKAQTTEEKNRLNEEFKTFQTKARHRKLGYMRFLGELFLLQMLTVNIMHECVICLLKAADEESLEYLCRLWTTIGKVLDTNDKARGYNDQYFAQMKKIATGQIRNVSVRIRFALQDVIELRQNNWVPRRDKSTPKTLEEIHQQMAIEAHEKQVMIDKGLPSRPSGGRVIQPPRGNRRDEQEGWSHVKTGTQRVDPTKLRLTSQKVGGDKELQLGPAKSFGGWGKGSSGSGKSTPPQQEERQSAPGNRFSALSGAGTDSHVRDERSRSGNRLPMGRGSMSRGRGGSNRMGTPRGSMEKEKSSAVEMARQLSKGSRGPSRENSVDGRNMRTPTPTRGQVNRPSAQSTAPVVKQLSRTDWETKSKSITDEYLHNNDIQEVLDIFRDELASQADKELFTELCINHTLERSQQARRGTGNMLAELIKHKLLPLDAHLKGLSAVLEFAEDLAIDIPNVWKYLGELVAPMFTTAALPLSQLETVCGPLLAIDKAALLAVAILSEASQKVGHVELGKRWADSKLTWSKFLPAGEDEQSFIVSNKLEYTVTSPDASQPTTSLSTSDISAQLDKLLITDRAPNEAIFDWIDAKLSSDIRGEPAFIRSLTTSVVKSCIKRQAMQETEFKDRAPLLLKYYDSKAERELAALSAFEDLMTSLEHPADLFSDFCYALSELELIADESFYHWESSSKNGIAVKSVGKFLKWLKDA